MSLFLNHVNILSFWSCLEVYILLLKLAAETLPTPAEALDRMQIDERGEGEEEKDGNDKNSD